MRCRIQFEVLMYIGDSTVRLMGMLRTKAIRIGARATLCYA